LSCDLGICSIISCVEGYANCDGISENGCESDLNEQFNCGECNVTIPQGSCIEGITYCGAVPCSTQNSATVACQSGFCTVISCDYGFLDCDGDALNGCEVDLRTDLENCGACGVKVEEGGQCVNDCIFLNDWIGSQIDISVPTGCCSVEDGVVCDSFGRITEM
jgi:hypothetical protein